MRSTDQTSDTQQRVFRAILILSMLAVFLRANSLGHEPLAALVSADTDDIMRFLSVRNWIAGQGWYDMVQAGVVADGGLLLHWSRLVDAGIAAIIWPLSFALPVAEAEAAGVVLWPILLLGVLLYVTATQSLRHFGPMAATGTVLCFLMWPAVAFSFAPTRIDHHNVQIFLLTIVILALLRADNGWRSGAVAGMATALSLAVGLETGPSLGLAGILLSLMTLTRPMHFSNALIGYGATLGPAAVTFFALQTSPETWQVARCDQLGYPLLRVIGAASSAAVAFGFLLQSARATASRTVLFVMLYGAALALALPTLASCSGGPYGDLPPVVQETIYAQIKEAKPALLVAKSSPLAFHSNAVPLFIGLTLASLIAFFDRDVARRNRVILLLVFGGMAALATLHQMRMLVSGVAVLPLIAGYILGWLMEWRQHQKYRAMAGILAIFAGMVTIIYPKVAAYALNTRTEAEKTYTEKREISTYSQCRTDEVLKPLANLPRGAVLSTMNLGPSILLSSGQPILAAPYHRSAAAMVNGLLFISQNDAESFHAAVREIGAVYVVLCQNEIQYGFASKLSRGEHVPGLTLVPGFDPSLVVYRVLP